VQPPSSVSVPCLHDIWEWSHRVSCLVLLATCLDVSFGGRSCPTAVPSTQPLRTRAPSRSATTVRLCDPHDCVMHARGRDHCWDRGSPYGGKARAGDDVVEHFRPPSAWAVVADQHTWRSCRSSSSCTSPQTGELRGAPVCRLVCQKHVLTKPVCVASSQPMEELEQEVPPGKEVECLTQRLQGHFKRCEHTQHGVFPLEASERLTTLLCTATDAQRRR
jgi:hypothetical protein